jgi:hypothetical protein
VSEARALFAGPGAWRELVDGRFGAVELVLSRGAYVSLGSGWLLVTGRGAPFGPLSLAVERLEVVAPQPGTPAFVTRGRLILGECAVSLERARERPAVALGVLAESPAVSAAAAAARAALPGVPAILRDGHAALVAGRLEDAVRRLAGLGDGLTPAGDDVLAGYAAARVAVGALVALSSRCARRSSPLGLAYLRCAERGELADVAARLLAAICRGSTPAALAALPGLHSWGSSSGVALAWGITAAFKQPTERSDRWLDSDWGSTCSRTPKSSTSPRRTACGRSRGASTPSSTPS